MPPAPDRRSPNRFCFWFEPISNPTSGSTRRDDAPTARLRIPNRLAVILAGPGCPPQLVNRVRFDPERTFIIQPLWDRPRGQLLLLSPGSRRPLVNGRPAPAVTLLSIGDEILFCTSSCVIAHLTVFVRPQIGPSPRDVSGKRCPICKTKFVRDSIVYRCHGCSQLLHGGRPGNADRQGLNCAHLCKACPICQSPIQLTAGYAYLPEFLQEVRP